jgi:hypothetical protein
VPARDEPVEAQLTEIREGGVDPSSRVDRDRHDRQILGQREQAVGMKMVLDAEALDLRMTMLVCSSWRA